MDPDIALTNEIERGTVMKQVISLILIAFCFGLYSCEKKIRMRLIYLLISPGKA